MLHLVFLYAKFKGYEHLRYRFDRLMVVRVVGGRAVERSAASTSLMSRFETEILTQPENLEALMNLPGIWVDRVHKGTPLKQVILESEMKFSGVAEQG